MVAGPRGRQPVARGQVLGGKYKIERVLGEGGMGIVVAARHIELGQRVALKLMQPQREESPASRERFLREARAAVRLRSEHAARVLDVGTFERGGLETPYIVMEYLDGSDLARVLDDRGALPVDDAIEYLLHACEAVAEAHARHVVHRDLKPANLFLTKRADGTPCVKVLDFGISKLADPGQMEGSLSRTAAVMGTPFYMAPEQMRSSKGVDARADVWSLGVIAYELLTGRIPFAGESITELCANVIEQTPVSPAELRESLPPPLVDVVLRCLSKPPADRPTLVELAAALAPFGSARVGGYPDRVARVAEEAVSQRDLDDVEPVSTLGPGSITGAAWHSERRPSAGFPWRMAVVAGAVCAAAAVAGHELASRRQGAEASPVSAPETALVTLGGADEGSSSRVSVPAPAARTAVPSATGPRAAASAKPHPAPTVPPPIAPTSASAQPSATAELPPPKCEWTDYYDGEKGIPTKKWVCH